MNISSGWKIDEQIDWARNVSNNQQKNQTEYRPQFLESILKDRLNQEPIKETII